MPDSLDSPTTARTQTNRARRNTGRTVLSDVAKLAGVSTATVSRVYNEPDKVSANVRERVEQAALALNWFPNAAGRALASTRSHIAGIIIPTLDDQVFASQVSGMQAAFAARGITLVLGCSNYDPAQALVQVRAMLARGVEAMAVVGEAHPPELFDALRLYRVPYAVTYAYRGDSPHTCIGFDNHAAYVEIAEHLIGLGHRSFAVCIQPTRDNDRVQARVAGIRATLERHGLAVRPEHMLEGESTIGFGRRCLRAIWQAPGERPSAIICGNDHIAIGVLREAEDLGIAIPDELSVTGFDDLEIAKELRPALTTMRVDTYAIGRLTAQHLLDVLDGKHPRHEHAGHEVHAELQLRQSTGPCRR
ncbi:LacI family DNA-binding transcriptional regulator [Paraburkholderia sp. 22099]|jgi:LacI family transcriptional regulator|uniref:LacI family DNA-binding transcriptional regulator n=1 Tax=Paraburkholderia TaxID=1822464 RepID=UPI001FD15C87|nr:LacI family DNA-binding transcriptional regulator [Paraburkholderia terricola]MDR6446603.1 LacI family transcriptional regulator [Paraburkholderia terricola]MDR6490181.1 LacI family transcriptional regulator [Paraburkholderia terricola]